MTLRRRALAVLVCLSAAASTLWLSERDSAAQPKPSTTEDPGKIEELSLAVGETRTLSARGVKNYSIALADVVEARLTPDGSQFAIVGKRAGTTTLLLLYDDGTRRTFDIRVTARPEAVVARELEQLLAGTPGVEIKVIGGRFFLEGSVGTEGELQRLRQLAQLYPGQVESLVTVGAGGTVDRSLLIRIDFFFVQYDTSSSYAVGLGWPAAIGGEGVVTNQLTYDFISGTTTTAQASIVNQPLPRLDIASNRGWAKILRQSSVITSNGMEAKYDSGGEQNFVVNTGLTIGLEQVTFGTIVTVFPRYDRKFDRIDLRIVSDVSDLTAPVSSNIPGRIFSRLVTNVGLKLGQALVLSGLQAKSQRHNVSGLPFLKDIPILGLFFGSHGDARQETENAMFVIPSIVESVPASSLALINKALEEYREFSGDLDEVEPFIRRPPSAR